MLSDESELSIRIIFLKVKPNSVGVLSLKIVFLLKNNKYCDDSVSAVDTSANGIYPQDYHKHRTLYDLQKFFKSNVTK